MDNNGKSPASEETYRNYLARMKEIDLQAMAGRMGVGFSSDKISLPLFGNLFRVSPEGITGPDGREAANAEKIVLCMYVLLNPETEPKGGTDYVSYRDFRDAAPFVGAFRTNVEMQIARTFGADPALLLDACGQTGGMDPGLGLEYEVSMKFEALPRVPVILLFNGADDEFPADARILFERRAEKYLDMECLAGLGWMLSDHLHAAAGKTGPGIL